MPKPTVKIKEANTPDFDWEQFTLLSLIQALNIPQGSTPTIDNLSTRALAYALCLRGWDGSVETRSRFSMASIGRDQEETCLDWNGEKLTASGKGFSDSLVKVKKGPVDSRCQEASKCFPPVILRRYEGLFAQMSSRVDALILSYTQAPVSHHIDGSSRPRL